MWVTHVDDDFGKTHRTYECPECFHSTTLIIRKSQSTTATLV